MANEDVSIYKDYLKNSRRILSVISSGDQIIESITSEKKIIDCFDISKYPKYYHQYLSYKDLTMEHANKLLRSDC